MPSTSTATTASANTTGPVLLDLDIPDYAEVDIRVEPGLQTASAELRGSDSVRRDAKFATHGSTWSIRLPDLPAQAQTAMRGNRVTQNITHVSRGQRVVGAVVNGSVTIAGGDITINNHRVTGQPYSSSEQIRILVRLPAGSALRSRVEAGHVVARGMLAAVEYTTTSADLDIETAGRLEARSVSGDIEVERVTGAAEAETVSGDVDIADARGPLRATTVSGDITATVHAAAVVSSTSGDVCLHAAGSVRVTATAVSGDVRVTAGPGAAPLVSAHARSGRVRTP